jgi:hypothetical protein
MNFFFNFMNNVKKEGQSYKYTVFTQQRTEGGIKDPVENQMKMLINARGTKWANFDFLRFKI